MSGISTNPKAKSFLQNPCIYTIIESLCNPIRNLIVRLAVPVPVATSLSNQVTIDIQIYSFPINGFAFQFDTLIILFLVR